MPEKDPDYGRRLDGPDAFLGYDEILKKEVEEILKLNPGLDTRERRPIVLPSWMTKDNQDRNTSLWT
ncbi:MAG: hypothetical protein LUI61_08325 [Firmicutes bacterium]|nr:hypothetical protein [Bacillota bacterium]MCD7831624.1 hypothetical protein [Bacillota bacterium]